ncbi:MAG: molybdopterin-guanine dinucleotide biosynthesis protein B [Methylococcales bacterium]|nr:molybdopterin-guanine dinucleotide biosynthesis protein B [Methylococcales bacterium]
MSKTNIPVLGFLAASGTGKTTLLTTLIPLLNAKKLRVGVIKHSHHNFEIDHEGKDSFRLRHAGGTPMVLVSKYRRVIIEEFPNQIEPHLEDQIALFDPSDIDLILVEGFRNSPIPKIELHRASLNKPTLYLNDSHIIAIATDINLDTTLPQLNLNQPNEIAEFILHKFLKL